MYHPKKVGNVSDFSKSTVSHGIFPEIKGESFIFLSKEQLDLERETIVPFCPQNHLSSMSILANV